MSEDGGTEVGSVPSPAVISRREALRKAGVAAGAAAFATPVVVGVFSTRAGAQADCDPTLDSDAVGAIIPTDSNWNQNCGGSNQFGRYNGQSINGTLPGTTLQVTIEIGGPGTLNEDVDVAFYTVVNPVGFECVASFEMGNASLGPVGCVAAGYQSQAISTPPVGTFPLPYCIDPGQSDDCPSGAKLFLTEVVCCPI